MSARQKRTDNGGVSGGDSLHQADGHSAKLEKEKAENGDFKIERQVKGRSR
jgi:hypothetical protein